MRLNKLALAAMIAATLGASGPAMAQTADMTAFNTACAGSQEFLVGEVPAGVDAPALMTALCACVATSFATFPQAEIDMLTTDLAQTSTDETHAAYPEYAALQQKAGTALGACFASPDVAALLPAVPAAQ